MNILSDKNAERALLSGLIRYGSILYHDVATLGLCSETFTDDTHKVIYRCLDKIFKEQDNIKPDIPLIYSAAADLGLKHFFQKDEEVQYLTAIIDLPSKKDNISSFAKKIKKLEILRNSILKLTETKDKLLEFSGTESINEIFGVLENNIIDCASYLSVDDLNVVKLSEGLIEHFEELEKNPISQVGVSTGFPIYDQAIGGGLRNGSVNIIAARPKCGKSTLALNIAHHISNLKVPILILDTEMSKQDSWTRLISSISQVNNKDIETGQYTSFLRNKNKVDSAIQSVIDLPLYYTSIAGQPLETQISIIKRWIITQVGLNLDGTAKPCVICYDYLKIMDESELKSLSEYQAVGFLVSALINFAKKYQLPVLAFVQMNRDGINREDTGTISLSDRILWFCSSLAIFKSKSSDEMDRDGWDNGNRKLKVLDCRYGPGMQDLEYVNCNFNKSISRIIEGKTNFELDKERKEKEKQIKLSENSNEDIVIEDGPISF